MAIGRERAVAEIRDIFDMLDADASGSLSWSELRENIGRWDPAKAETMISLADTDGNNEVDWEEFLGFSVKAMQYEDLDLERVTMENIMHFRNLFASFLQPPDD
eukprot:Hpha_TRINITY_DN15941_c5_g1::TRINITY_DN15941_c5_g1_i1::g.71811::m.71811